MIDVVGGTKIIKVGRVTSATPVLNYFCIFLVCRPGVNPHVKFKVSNCTHSKDVEGSQNYEHVYSSSE